MKKLMFVSLIVLVLALSGCNHNVVTPEPTVVEPTLPMEESTAIPTPIEEATEEPTPTLEPTPTPTEEPTLEPLPDRCPSEGSEIPDPEDLIIDLGEYGVFSAKESVFVSKVPIRTFVLSLYTSDDGVVRLIKDGQRISFSMPSAGFLYIPDMTQITINNQLWDAKAGIAVSPEGDFVIPKGSAVEMSVVNQIELGEFLLEILFISGDNINADDIALPQRSVLLCKTQWEMTIENTSDQDISVPIETGYPLLLTKVENIVSFENVWGEYFPEDIDIGYLLFDGDIVNLQPGGTVKFLVFDFYPYEHQE